MSDNPTEDPATDPHGAATARFLKGRIPAGARVAAPASFAAAIGPLTPPAGGALPDWAVVDTTEAGATPLPLIRQLLAQSNPVHANARYVVFARRPTFGLTDQRDAAEVRALAERVAAASPAATAPPLLPPLVPPPAPVAPSSASTQESVLPDPPAAATPPAPVPPSGALAFPQPSTAGTPLGSRPPLAPMAPTPWRPLSRPVPLAPRPVPLPAATPVGAPPPRPVLPPEALAAAARGAWQRPAVPAPDADPIPSPAHPAPAPAAPPPNEPAPPLPAAPPKPAVTAPALPTAIPPWGPGAAPWPTGLPGRVLALLGNAPVRSVATFGDAAPLAAAFPPSVAVRPAGDEDAEQSVHLALLADLDAAALPDALSRAARLLRPGGLAVIVAENADSLGRRLARALGREAGGGVTAARLRAAARAAGFHPALLEGFSLDPWRATSDAPPEPLAEGPAADLLEVAGRDAGPEHAARLLLLARLT